MKKITAIMIVVAALLAVFLIGFGFGNNASDSKSKSNSASNYHYIANRNSGKLHSINCDELPAEKNRVYFETIEDAREAGYVDNHVECMGK